jgi:hypothetical protein
LIKVAVNLGKLYRDIFLKMDLTVRDLGRGVKILLTWEDLRRTALSVFHSTEDWKAAVCLQSEGMMSERVTETHSVDNRIGLGSMFRGLGREES